MEKQNIRRLTNVLLEEYENDKLAAYAHVCNHTLSSNPDETLISIKRELEHRFALDAMEEYMWEQTNIGEWRKVENDEFWKRFRTAMERTGEKNEKSCTN